MFLGISRACHIMVKSVSGRGGIKGKSPPFLLENGEKMEVSKEPGTSDRIRDDYL